MIEEPRAELTNVMTITAGQWRAAAALCLLVAFATTPRVVSQQVDSTAPKTFATATPSTFSNFETDFTVFWAPEHIETTPTGQMLNLILTNVSGAGFGSKSTYLFGKINMNLKLIGGDSSGTVTTYYLSSTGDSHDELDFEFLGNRSGQPYILQTNVFASGVGEREQRILLWFDPSKDFHSYSVLWTKNIIVFEVDGVPIRTFRNNEAMGLPYLNAQPMGVKSSLWNGETWATEGGRIRVNWTYSPFIATFQNYNYDACEWTDIGAPPCANIGANNWWEAESYQSLSPAQANELRKIQQYYMVYDYCTDTKRWNITPPECATNLGLYSQSTNGAGAPAISTQSGGPTMSMSTSTSLSRSYRTSVHWTEILIGGIVGFTAATASALR